MRYVAAYLLAVLGGKESPSAKDLEKIVTSVGIEFDSKKADKLISELKGKKLEELIEAGKKKLSVIPAGGAAAAGAAPAAEKKDDKKEAPKKEEAKKKEEPKKEEEEEDMGFGLFD